MTTAQKLDALPLTEAELRQQELAKIEDLIQRTADDVGAPFEPQAMTMLAALAASDRAEWQRVRARLKRSNADLLVRELDKALRASSNTGDAEDSDSLADILAGIAASECELFHDADGEPYASFTRDDHTETWGVWSKGFSEWLSWRCYVEEGRAPRRNALDDALATIAGRAKFEGVERPVALRTAQHGNAYYLDLADDAWRAVEITPEGWRIVERPPVAFVRNSTMRPLPEPVVGGDIAELWELVNIPPAARLLVLAWLLECLRVETPYAVLELVGEQGSAKSSTQSLLRDLIDPSEVNLRAAPRSREDIFIAARNNHVVSFENLSHLGADYQDALCILATGGGFSSRTLYTNADETVIRVKRPVVLNGIAVVVVAQDLLSRTVHVNVPTLTAYQDEQTLRESIAEARPRLLGALLDLFAATLAGLPAVDIPAEQRPRMADFARLGEAMVRAMGHAPGTFLALYRENREDAIHRTIDALPVAAAALEWVSNNPLGFEGTAKALFAELASYKPDDATGWPKSPKGFADAMRRATPSLRVLGVEYREAGRGMNGYLCTLKRGGVRVDGGYHKVRFDVHEVHQVHGSVKKQPADELHEHDELESGPCYPRDARTTAPLASSPADAEEF